MIIDPSLPLASAPASASSSAYPDSIPVSVSVSVPVPVPVPLADHLLSGSEPHSHSHSHHPVPLPLPHPVPLPLPQPEPVSNSISNHSHSHSHSHSLPRSACSSPDLHPNSFSSISPSIHSSPSSPCLPLPINSSPASNLLRPNNPLLAQLPPLSLVPQRPSKRLAPSPSSNKRSRTLPPTNSPSPPLLNLPIHPNPTSNSSINYSSSALVPPLHSPSTSNDLSCLLDAAIAPLKLEISRLRSRIEILEDDRLITAREITFLKGCLKTADSDDRASRPRAGDELGSRSLAQDDYASRLLVAQELARRPLNSDSAPGSINGCHSHLASQHAVSHLVPMPAPALAPAPAPAPAPTTDIPVGPLPGSFSDVQPVVAADIPAGACAAGVVVDAKRSSGPTSATVLGVPAVSAFEEPFRRASTRRKSEGMAATNAASRAKHRKPELSRTVRATVFRLMGVSATHSPRAQSAMLPGEARFGSDKTRAYHGYTTTPCFPEYTAEELVDPETKAKVWRWDWSKTIRQSPNNTNFAKEIRSVIVREAADPVRPLHTEVPASDWAYLDVAIDSAYTNMRRERENLLDPNKMIKKEIHRARNKKRGLKEDKYKRRKRALDEYLCEPANYRARLVELGLELGDGPAGAEWEEALDLRYMSSEDEANVHELENPVPVGNDKADSALGVSDKVFAICRPEWRSEKVQNLFTVLDTIKQPERAYRRVMGSTRLVKPPSGTPGWMIKDGWGKDKEDGSTSSRQL